MTAASVMDPNPTVLKATDRISTAIRYIMDNRYRQLPVVDDDGRYLGCFGVNCLLLQALPPAVRMERGLENVSFIQETLSDLHSRLTEVGHEAVSVCLNPDVGVVAPDTPLIEALVRLHKTKASIPVVDPESGKLVGMISYWDVGEKILSA